MQYVRFLGKAGLKRVPDRLNGTIAECAGPRLGVIGRPGALRQGARAARLLELGTSICNVVTLVGCAFAVPCIGAVHGDAPHGPARGAARAVARVIVRSASTPRLVLSRQRGPTDAPAVRRRGVGHHGRDPRVRLSAVRPVPVDLGSSSASKSATTTELLPGLSGTATGTLTLTATVSPSPEPGQVSLFATVSAACPASVPTLSSCVAPAGTVRWQLDGIEEGGNVTENGGQVICAGPAGGASGASVDCTFGGRRLGDQWLTATYVAPIGGAPVALGATIVAHFASPVDLTAGRSYSAYDNIGPQGIGDCAVAAAADWVETTYNVTPDPNAIVATYRRAAARFDGGKDLGLTMTQLFRIWRTSGIGGTKLVARRRVQLRDVVHELQAGYALYASVDLSGAFDWVPTTDAEHDWIIVGYSSVGPMIESWGQEFQIPWRLFHRVTRGVWAIGTTAPA